MNYEIYVYKDSTFFKDMEIEGCKKTENGIVLNSSYDKAQELVRKLAKDHKDKTFIHHFYGTPYGEMRIVYSDGSVVYAKDKKPFICSCGFVWYEAPINGKCKLCEVNELFKK